MKFKRTSYIFIGSLIIFFSAIALSVWASFNEPPGGTIPPGNNASEPLNVGPITQFKAGALGIGGLLSAGFVEGGSGMHASGDICTDQGGVKCLSNVASSVIYTKGVGIRYTADNSPTGTFIGGTGTSISIPSSQGGCATCKEYYMVAPNCPAGYVAIGCKAWLEIPGVMSQIQDVASVDIGPLGGWKTPQWYFSYADALNGNKCTLRTFRPYGADYYPSAQCLRVR